MLSLPHLVSLVDIRPRVDKATDNSCLILVTRNDQRCSAVLARNDCSNNVQTKEAKFNLIHMKIAYHQIKKYDSIKSTI